MSCDYRKLLFQTYSSKHIAFLDTNDDEKQAWFQEYLRLAYHKHIAGLNPQSEFLEIGCSRGHLLKALDELGYGRLTGVDLSPGDLEIAARRVPSARFVNEDANSFLRANPARFDVIIAKAVLEHIPKPDVFPFLTSIRDALRPHGMAIIDVPNMDWLFASHERYMDFTHECGFTRESLRQVLGSVFLKVDVETFGNLFDERRLRLIERWKRRASRAILARLLALSDPQGGQNPIWDRSLIGVARQE